MIPGTVNASLEAVVQLRVRGPKGIEIELEALVDSGCAAPLRLPPDTVAFLGLARQRAGKAVLADGSIRRFGVFTAKVEWESGWQPVLVSAIGDEPLLGMRLMAGHRLCMAVVPGGAVEIIRLP